MKLFRFQNPRAVARVLLGAVFVYPLFVALILAVTKIVSADSAGVASPPPPALLLLLGTVWVGILVTSIGVAVDLWRRERNSALAFPLGFFSTGMLVFVLYYARTFLRA